MFENDLLECVLTVRGLVYCNGFVANSDSAEAIVGLANVIGITAGIDHDCALRAGGAVDCWGDNSWGQRGDGRTTTVEELDEPTQAIPSGAIAVAAGGFHTCALMEAGTVECWGYNGHGELGDGSTSERESPVPVAALTNVTAISAGSAHTCALLANRTVVCWGENTDGQLGDGTTIDRASPVPVNGLTDVIAISAGGHHTCAIVFDGSVECWGSNGEGQLGRAGTANGSSVPVSVSGFVL